MSFYSTANRLHLNVIPHSWSHIKLSFEMCKSENQFSLVVLNSGRASGQENPLRLISSSFFLFMEVSLYLDIHEILILRARKPSITSDELALNNPFVLFSSNTLTKQHEKADRSQIWWQRVWKIWNLSCLAAWSL